jgi:hypothetical protein
VLYLARVSVKPDEGIGAVKFRGLNQPAELAGDFRAVYISQVRPAACALRARSGSRRMPAVAAGLEGRLIIR